MHAPYRLLAAAAVLAFAAATAYAATEAEIMTGLKGLRALGPDKRPAATMQLAHEIDSLPAGTTKVELATDLAGLSTEGDAGHDTLQAVADALSHALAQTPAPAKDDKPPYQYVELATLVRYEGVTTKLTDALYLKALKVLEDEDADVSAADFTLKDLDGRSVTLSQLRGKIVMVNFWATWCPPCRAEMPQLDELNAKYAAQGLVVVSITDEDAAKVSKFIQASNYHPEVLLDPGDTVHSQLHVEGIPRTFVFNRQGKLVAEAIDQRTMHQFLMMLSKTDLHP